MTTSADEPRQEVEPVYCGMCLYGSDVGVPGYDDKGPAYVNPVCLVHGEPPESSVRPGTT